MNHISSGRPTVAEIDLDNLAFNFNSVKSFVGDSVKYMAVVKADAYGHGSVPCAKRLEAENVDWFGVAIPEEGLELRRAGINKPILSLGGFWSGQEALILDKRITPVVYQVECARTLDDAAHLRGTSAAIHVKVDTGMGRIGIRYDEAAAFANDLRAFPNLRVEGLMTHFASADDLEQNEFTNLQVKRFIGAVEAFREQGHNPAYLDLANSPGAVAHPVSPGNMVRLGGVLYGLGGDVLPRGIEKPELRPVLALKTKIASLKSVLKDETIGYGRTFRATQDITVAALPIGYQDGLNRLLSNKGRVLIRGTSCRIIGRISMDWTMVDVSKVLKVSDGDVVTIIGDDTGPGVTAEEMAKAIGSISYEVTCSIDRRVPRVYNSL